MSNKATTPVGKIIEDLRAENDYLKECILRLEQELTTLMSRITD